MACPLGALPFPCTALEEEVFGYGEVVCVFGALADDLLDEALLRRWPDFKGPFFVSEVVDWVFAVAALDDELLDEDLLGGWAAFEEDVFIFDEVDCVLEALANNLLEEGLVGCCLDFERVVFKLADEEYFFGVLTDDLCDEGLLGDWPDFEGDEMLLEELDCLKGTFSCASIGLWLCGFLTGAFSFAFLNFCPK